MQSLEQQLSRVDLNLLVSLSVLIQEKNVSRAAEKLYLSQPAMSRCLQKLRELFDDPLFYRESAGLRPTLKTLQLEKQLTPILEQLQQFISKEHFEPSSCERAFSISLPSLMSSALLLPVIKELSQSAPNIVIEQHPVTSEPEKFLESGHFDFILDLKPSLHKGFSSSCCGQTYPVIYARKDHPLAKQDKVSIEQCINYKFVDLLVDNQANLQVDNPGKRYFTENNLQLQVVFRSGQLGLLTEVMKESEHLLLTNHFIAGAPEITNDLVPIYKFSQPQYQVQLYLTDHQRTHNSEAHQWLKTQLLNSFQQTVNAI